MAVGNQNRWFGLSLLRKLEQNNRGHPNFISRIEFLCFWFFSSFWICFLDCTQIMESKCLVYWQYIVIFKSWLFLIWCFYVVSAFAIKFFMQLQKLIEETCLHVKNHRQLDCEPLRTGNNNMPKNKKWQMYEIGHAIQWSFDPLFNVVWNFIMCGDNWCSCWKVVDSHSFSQSDKHRTWRMFKDPIFWHPNFTFGTWPKIPYDSINKFGISYSLLQFVLAAAGLRSLQK